MDVDALDTKRKYTQQEKQQLLANLDIEVEHKVRQFEAWLLDALEDFRIAQENQISRIPKVVRGLTMREFGDKYNGDVQAAVRGVQRERMGADAGAGDIEIDKSTRKRKWVASMEAEQQLAEGSKSFKNARMASVSPKKKPGSSTGPGTAQRARLVSANRTPGASRTMGRIPPSPSPTKPLRYGAGPSRPVSPAKPQTQINGKPIRATRPPSIATFNPSLPKTPGFPKVSTAHTNATARPPRRHESMLSINGSPLANPYELGLEWFAEGGDEDDDSPSAEEAEDAQIKKKRSSIIVRRDPSFSFQAAPLNGLHSRTTSQSSLLTSSSQTQSSSQSHSNSNFETPRAPLRNPLSRMPSSTTMALVTIPTKDGHLLEFDPLQTSPGTIDALDGITDSAKKQAKEDMGRLVQAAVAKWKIV